MQLVRLGEAQALQDANHEEGRGKTFLEEVDAQEVIFKVFALYPAHYYKRVFLDRRAKALTLRALDALLVRLSCP